MHILLHDRDRYNLIDITNLDEQHYESFLEAMQKLQIAYKVAKESNSKTRVFTETVSPLGIDILNGKI